MPVRKIPKSHCGVTGLISSDKSLEMTAYEFDLERDCYKLLIFNSNVIKIEEQPVKVYYEDSNGKPHSYTPDVLITFREELTPPEQWKPLLAEIKPRRWLFKNWAELKPKFKAARRDARERDWDFTIITDPEIRTPYLKSAVFLLEFLELIPNEIYTNLLLDALNRSYETTPAALLHAITEKPDVKAELIPYLWQLAASHRIGINLEEPLTMRSRIWPLQLHEEDERNAHFYQPRAGRSRRKRWQALRYYPPSGP